jgi:hypothetical protein
VRRVALPYLTGAHAGYKLPDVLSKFLCEEGHIFVRAHISNDVEHLQQECGIKISNWRNLQLIVSEVDDKYSHLYQNGYRSSLEKIGNVVLELPLYKDRKVTQAVGFEVFARLAGELRLQGCISVF